MNSYSHLLQHELLSKKVTYSLIAEYQSTSDLLIKQKVLDKLIKHNFKLIYKIAAKFFHSHSQVELEDCIQVVCLSLEKCVEKFDLTRGLAMSTYLTWWAKGYLQRHYQKTNRTIYIPIYVQENYRLIRKFTSQYSLINNTSPSLLEIATELDISVDKVKEIVSHFSNIVSLNTVIFNEGVNGSNNTELLDLIENSTLTPDNNLDNYDKIEYLNTLLNSLNSSDRELLILRYGLNGSTPYTLNQLADELGINREQVRRRISNSLGLLRRSSLIKGIKG